MPPDVGPVTDAKALLSFAWKGGFLKSAVLGLARTAFSEYRKIREEIGLSQYSEEEMIDILDEAGFAAERRRAQPGAQPGPDDIHGAAGLEAAMQGRRKRERRSLASDRPRTTRPPTARTAPTQPVEAKP